MGIRLFFLGGFLIDRNWSLLQGVNVSNTSKLPQIDMSYFSGKGHTALSELMRAIILRAIEDFHSNGAFKEEALKYFYGITDSNDDSEDSDDNEEYIFSFKAICDHFDLDPEKTRSAIINAEHRISTRRRSV